MQCMQCSTELPENARFCFSCGLPVSPVPVPSLPVLLKQLKEACDSQDWEAAVRLGEQVLQCDPQSARAKELLAQAYTQTARLLCVDGITEKHKQAFALADKALRLDPHNAEAWVIKGTTYTSATEGDFLERYKASRAFYDQALADYTHRIGQDPDQLGLYRARGQVFCQRGAITQYLARLASSFETSETFRSEDFDLALTDYQTALDLAPGDAETYYLRGSLYGREMREFAKAEEDLTHAIELSCPKLADAYKERGNVRFMQKQFDQSLEDLNQAVALSSDWALERRGKLRIELGEWDNALRDYNLYLIARQAKGGDAGWEQFMYDLGRIVESCIKAGQYEQAWARAANFMQRFTGDYVNHYWFNFSFFRPLIKLLVETMGKSTSDPQWSINYKVGGALKEIWAKANEKTRGDFDSYLSTVGALSFPHRSHKHRFFDEFLKMLVELGSTWAIKRQAELEHEKQQRTENIAHYRSSIENSPLSMDNYYYCAQAYLDLGSVQK